MLVKILKNEGLRETLLDIESEIKSSTISSENETEVEIGKEPLKK